MNSNHKISVLVSGGGTNLQALIDSISCGSLKGVEIALVISSREGAFALERAKRAGIKTAVVAGGLSVSEAALAEELVKNLEEAGTELIVLAGYMRILHPLIIKKYPRRIINIHPSLIPRHCGKGFYGSKVHEAVIRAGDRVSGATVHFVDEGVDTGEIILQREVPVESGESPKTLAAKVLAAEHEILPEAVRMIFECKI